MLVSHLAQNVSSMYELLAEIADKSLTKKMLYGKVEQNFGLVSTLLEGTSSAKATVRYGCGSVLMNLSEKYPEKLYPYMDQFLALLDSKHRILCWNAIYIIANLSCVDKNQKFEAAFAKYYSLFNSGYMVTVANLVDASGKIALAKPKLANQIAQQLLKAESLEITPHLTGECKLVIAEHAIESFSLFFNELDHNTKGKVYGFVERQQGSPRQSLSKQAAAFVKKWKV
jgi:hypothetical protein